MLKQIQIQGFGKEPEWMREYREKNLELSERIQLQKSKHTNTEQEWQEMLSIKSQKNSIKATGKNIEILSWQKAMEKYPKQIQKALEKETIPETKTEAFANAAFNNGIVAFLNNKNKLSEIEIKAEKEGIAKNLFIFMENTETTLIEKISGEKTIALNETALAKQGAITGQCRIIEHMGNILLQQQNIMEKDSQTKNSSFFLQGKKTKAKTLNSLAGQGAETQQIDIQFGKQEQFLDYSLKNLHATTDTKSYSLFKNALTGEAKSVFDGMIKIPKKGQKSNALLEAHSILLSETASANNIPGLEIEADDVKATHSASAEQIDEEHLFYLQAKGIQEKTAKKLVITAFLESAILKMPAAIQEKIAQQLAKELEKQFN